VRSLKSVLPLIITLSTAFSQASYACDLHGKTGILPENNLNIPVGLKFLDGGISQVQFNKVIDRVSALYTPVVAKLGGKLNFNRNWTDGTVNAYADRGPTDNGKIWNVSMFGGLARHPLMNEDGFAVVVCHELGHHLGGAPRKSDSTGALRWAANEGQADYYATLKCLRNYFANQNNESAVKNIQIPAILSNACQSSFANSNEIAVCERSAMAGLTLGKFFKVLMNNAVDVSLSTPDTKKVATTYDAHPASQCRVDTFYQGSLCDKSVKEDTSTTDVNIGTCTERNGDTVGLRPNCWYAVPN
jgi:hypothetical protein